MPEITTPDSGLVAFRQDVHKLLRRRVLEAMEIVLEEELSEGFCQLSEAGARGAVGIESGFVSHTSPRSKQGRREPAAIVG